MEWQPSRYATTIESPLDGDRARAGSILVDHCNDPYDVALPDEEDASLQQAAHDYLAALLACDFVASRVALPAHWLAALDPAQPAAAQWFGWLPFAASAHADDFVGPARSFRFASKSDKLAALFASERLASGQYIGSGFGLGVIVRIRDGGEGPRASFVGLTATLPEGDDLSNSLAAWAERTGAVEPMAKRVAWLARLVTQHSAEAIRATTAAAGLEPVVVRGVRIAVPPGGLRLQWQGIGLRRVMLGPPDADDKQPAALEIPYFFSVLTVLRGQERLETLQHLAPMVADAAGDARVFDADPSSQSGCLVRPTRDESVLDASRARRPILPKVAKGTLQHPPGAASPIVQVVTCPGYVPAERPPRKPRDVTIASPGPGVRTDDASAIQAFFHARDLIERLQAYGWTDAAAYFRATRPEIRIFYRSGVSPGPGKDGRTVNARVLPEGWPANAVGMLPDSQARPAIGIHLAGADLRRRGREKWQPGGPVAPAVPFGLGADRRWLWHEFGHVLLVASTGELEFRFAHSAGDALAAIVADPQSQLPARLRALTFPFVCLPRRHNRCALEGWSWSGTQHAELARVPDALHPRRKGYASEQILSSSLFRLYRCMGGDTCETVAAAKPDVRERLRASHYCVYLLMQAMQLMGDARIQAIATPAQFVHLLRQADRQTGTWSAVLGSATFARVGGTLAKVIRWAFEAQGLYGDGNGPGQSAPVDIYIEDLRPTRDDAQYGGADYGAGTYVPVSLHWQSADLGAPGAAPPLWQADPQGGIAWDSAAGTVRVFVGNRGQVAAQRVQVQLWSVEWPDQMPAPVWQGGSGSWQQCPASEQAGQAVPAPPAGQAIQPGPPAAGQGFTFQFAPAPGSRHVLLASATCRDDRANIDPLLLLACCSTDTPLADLVANDNNLALLVVRA